jgi:hypothetical protein
LILFIRNCQLLQSYQGAFLVIFEIGQLSSAVDSQIPEKRGVVNEYFNILLVEFSLRICLHLILDET